MLVLFETPAGYSLFKVSDEKKLSKTSPEDIHETFFSSSKRVNKYLQLQSFEPFADTADAVSAASALVEGKVSKSLASFLKKKTKKLGSDVPLAIADKAMASSLKESLPNLSVVHDGKTQELFRGIREHLEDLITAVDGDDDDGLTSKDLKAMQLGLSHSLSRYKLKFSADKVDTMIIQAIGLLDELDKEINTYAMRVKEWYGWHFPELQGLVSDNIQYSKCVTQCGLRENYAASDLSNIFEDESQEQQIKETAELSMGTEIAELDILHIQQLADQVLHMTEYRAQLFEYIKNRMNAIAPNLTILVGELVGARLIAHSGSLMNLAKQPASTVQILGAEKALFRALKTKHNTPKYGLIYHASLIGQASAKNKGKISRVLAAKAALAIRVDALTDDTPTGDGDDDDAAADEIDTTVGFEGRAKVEARLRQLEGGGSGAYNPQGSLTSSKISKYDPVAAKIGSKGPGYNDASDMVLEPAEETPKEKKKKEKKEKKEKKRKSKEGSTPVKQEDSSEEGEETPKSSSKKKKRKHSEEMDNGDDDDSAAAKKAAKKAKKEAKKAKKEKRKSKE